MAKIKLHNISDELPWKIFKTMCELDKDSFVQQLSLVVSRPKLNGFTASEILACNNSLGTDAQVVEALESLHADKTGLITTSGMAAKQAKYAIDWHSAFSSLQQMLIEKYVEDIYGKHHVRVFRILRQKGFTEEKELTKLCLLPQKNLRVILTKFVNEGFIQIQEKP